VYQSGIGVPSTGDEAYGYWVFVLGVLAGFVGVALVMLSQEPGELIRGVGVAIAAIGLVLLLIGPIIRLPLKRGATILSYIGGLIALVGVGWFFLAFQAGNWGAAFENSEGLIIGVYGLGIFAIVLGSVFDPLLTSPREEQMAAEERAATAGGRTRTDRVQPVTVRALH
jgi:energy-coupling factor transporter transmembrane protein EcfT